VAWNRTSRLLATCGSNGMLAVYTRTGELFWDGLLTKGTVQCIEWDRDGQICAVLLLGAPAVYLFSATTKKLTTLETKDPTFLCWSPVAPLLAVASGKGNVMIYNSWTQKREIFQNRHSKKITCGMWNVEGKLALGGLDNLITVSDANGTILSTIPVKNEPISITFAEQKADESKSLGAAREDTLSVNAGYSKILLQSLTEPEAPVELSFQSYYGDIRVYRWFGDGYMLIGFSNGHVVPLSSHMKEVQQELRSLKAHAARCNDLTCSRQLQRAVTVGDDGMRVFDMVTWKEVPRSARVFTPQEGEPVSCIFSPDSQVLTITTSRGYIMSFISRLPPVGASDPRGLRMAYLSSLVQVTVAPVLEPASPSIPLSFSANTSYGGPASSPAASPTSNLADGQGVGQSTMALPPPQTAMGPSTTGVPTSFYGQTPIQVAVAAEPVHIALGPKHLAVASGDCCWVYHLDAAQQQPTQTPAPQVPANANPLLQVPSQPEPAIPTIRSAAGCVLNVPATVDDLWVTLNYVAALSGGSIYVYSTASLASAQAVSQSTPGANHDMSPVISGMTSGPGGMSTPAIPGFESARHHFVLPAGANMAGAAGTAGATGGPSGGSGEATQVVAMAMTPDFIIYSLRDCSIVYYLLTQSAVVATYKHTSIVTKLWPSPTGTRVCFVDSAGHAFVLNAADGSVAPLPGGNLSIANVIWDTAPGAGESVFVAITAESQEQPMNAHSANPEAHAASAGPQVSSAVILTFVCSFGTALGPIVWLAGSTSKSALPDGFIPLHLLGGMLHGTGDPALPPGSVTLNSHRHCAIFFQPSAIYMAAREASNSVQTVLPYLTTLTPATSGSMQSISLNGGGASSKPGDSIGAVGAEDMLGGKVLTSGPQIPGMGDRPAGASSANAVIDPAAHPPAARQNIASSALAAARIGLAHEASFLSSAACQSWCQSAFSMFPPGALSASSLSASGIQTLLLYQQQQLQHTGVVMDKSQPQGTTTSGANSASPASGTIAAHIARELLALGRLRECWAVARQLNPNTPGLPNSSQLPWSLSSILDPFIQQLFPSPVTSSDSSSSSAGNPSAPPAPPRGRPLLRQLGVAAMLSLDMELASAVFAMTRDTAWAMVTNRLKHVEDLDLLCGFVAMFRGDFNNAQRLFLQSSSPIEALQLRRALGHWQAALTLAQDYAPHLVADLAREGGASLEAQGNYEEALAYFTRSTQAYAQHFETSKPSPQVAMMSAAERAAAAASNELARAGVARCLLRKGDVLQGLQIVQSLESNAVKRECAALLEQMKLLTDAADLYLNAQCWEKAASLYIQTKNFAKADKIMENVTAPKLHLAFGKAKEAMKQYADALMSYERARDIVACVKLLLGPLREPSRAYALIRTTRSPQAALLAADFAVAQSDFGPAVEFLLIAKQERKAFDLAKKHNKLAEYAEALGDNGTIEDYTNIAAFYASQNDLRNAGKFYARAQNPELAVQCFVRAGEDCIEDAIEVIRKLHNSLQPQEGQEPEGQAATGAIQAQIAHLVRLVHDYLIGEADGEIKSPRLIFALYTAIGEYMQAANTAIMISEIEQKRGNYTIAHSILLDTYRDLRRNGVNPPLRLFRALLLIHSYTLVKRLVKRGEHHSAAVLLVRVSRQISQFPAHVVPILTSTVVECQRAGMKQTSCEFAVILARSEYRAQIVEKYRKKIEALARRPETEETPESVSPCPLCQFQLVDSLVDCPSCHGVIPFCTSTGLHIKANDCCLCPSCEMPSSYTEMVKSITEFNEGCAMCGAELTVAQLRRMAPDEVPQWIRKVMHWS